MIVVICPHCQAKSQAPDAAHGRRLPCPKCAKPLVVGSSVDAESEPSPTESLPDEFLSEPEPVKFFETVPQLPNEPEPKPEPDWKFAIKPQEPKPLLWKRFQSLAFSDRRKFDNEFCNLKTVLSIYQILLIIVLVIQSMGWVVWCFTGAGIGATVVSTFAEVEFGRIMFWVVGVLCFAVCGAFAALMIWLQYIFAMAFIDFVRVIVAIEKNTRIVPS